MQIIKARRSFVVAVVAAGLCGFTQQPLTPQYDPFHYVNNDPAWNLLNEASVTSDAAKGEYKATFPPDLLRLQGARFKVSGFILPLDAMPATLHFAVVRRNTACPFCPPNTPTEAVEVFSQELVKYTGEQVTVTGQLTLVSSSAEGLFYRLDRAVVVVG
jgi:hypothetical protein